MNNTGPDTTLEVRGTGAVHAQMDAATGLVLLSGLIQAVYQRVSERHDLTPVQARLLCVLLNGPRGMAELAGCFGVEKAALTGLMNRAERRGLALRSSVPGDRRAIQVTLTDEGRQAAVAFHTEMRAEMDRLLLPLADEDRERFRSTMAAIVTRCGAGPC
ncbi:MarR family winged helix-turn-helix transcriptional regulator [Nonomuraea zeae]|uniref:MarR family transcriptional regulator n=1 Tax=Nonomuraea zeae TaxID=1642303 RepID=A0A5S4FR33_9ACTN|nr:MarR family transcriptional regulator [Nonomuraea zeae]TMR23049.1 MarR family transcriptional regulator [Nonomuraea zeae]